MRSSTAKLSLKRLWILACIIVVVAGVFLVIRNHRLNASGLKGKGSLKLAACVPAGRHPSIAPLQLTEMRARRLGMEQRHDEAIALYREIARTDAAFPGIQLDLSVALLEAKELQQASDAVDAQLATSGCLLTLPQEQLETYCQAEMPGLPIPACQQQVAGLQRTAHLQAALVQMQLGRNDRVPAAAEPQK